MVVRPSVAVALLALPLLLSCGEDKLVTTPCRDDSACEGAFLCEDFRCVPAETKSCEVVIDGNPILQPAPFAVSLGDLDVQETTTTVTLHNLGTCTLTLFEAALEGGEESAFRCVECQDAFPLEVFPGRSRTLQLEFKAKSVGAFHDQLVILSDDKEFPEMRVPLHANFLGVPDLRVAPNPIDFGYVAQGRQALRTVQLSNQGTGVAPITVEAVALSPADTPNFTLTTEAELPVGLNPAAGDPKALLTYTLQYHPRTTAIHTIELVVTTNKGEVRVPVSGNAETPPKLTVNPSSIDLGQVPLGQTNVQALTLVNEGGAPLTVEYLWGGTKPNTDLFATPTVIPQIKAGNYLELQVGFTATAVGKVNGLLVISSNDPSRPSLTIEVSAEGVPGPGPEVVKIEMTYANGSDSAFDQDLRNVDLTLEHPYGYVCNQDYPNPTNWGNYGNPSWIAFGPKQEPERIVLADATQDGTWRVMLQYMEDCKSLPTELLAGVLGISVDVLIAYLTGGASIINGQDVGQLIKNLCLDHSDTQATVRVYVNGTVIQEKTVTLGKMGDTAYAVDLIRSGGKFSAK